MKKRINPVKYNPGFIYPFLFLSVLFISTSFAQEIENRPGNELSVSYSVFTIAANINFDRMSISYDGLPGSHGLLFHPGRDSYMLKSSTQPDEILEKNSDHDSLYSFEEKLKQVTRFFLRYFNIDGFSTGDEGSKFLLKSRVDATKEPPAVFEYNLSLNIGYDDNTTLIMNTVKLESYWFHTYVNAIYHYQESELELGLSSDYLNDYLFKGMKLEFLANPGAGSGAVLLTTTF
ncbi:MAG: hypothetical protein GXP56_05685 [Deltaproteobacteria bacterium]|nr:hypothetical protein [Deltaproteobacteria bacterium]